MPGRRREQRQPRRPGRAGARRGPRPPDFVLLWADEGLGAALVLGGRLHRGATGGAGEVGYMPTPGAPTARDTGRYANHGYQALTGGPAVLKILRSYGVRGATPAQAVRNAVQPRPPPAGAPTTPAPGCATSPPGSPSGWPRSPPSSTPSSSC